MADNGWIKLHRRLVDSLVWQASNCKQRDILINLLLMASHCEKDWIWKGQRFSLEPGQFITSLDSIKSKCSNEVTVQNIRTALVHFERLDFLTNDSTKTGRLITIVNWGFYQGGEDDANKASNRQLTKSQQRANKELTPIKNDKNVKNEKNLYIGLPDELVKALDDFKESRNKLRKPMTERAVELLIMQLQKMTGGDTRRCVELLEEAIKKGWLSVYDSTKKKGSNFMEL